MSDDRKLTEDEIAVLFEREDEHGQFDKISPARKLHRLPGLTAMLLVDRLCPAEHQVITSGTEYWFSFDVTFTDLADKATEEDILDLVRCGVFSRGAFIYLSN